MSIPIARFAPSFNAAIAKIPEPQPKSITVLPAKSSPSNHCKQSAVVGCVPVPNAKPGSNITLTAFGSGTSRQLGQIHKRLPNCIGWKLSIHSRSQSLSSICSILCAKSGSTKRLMINASTIAFISVSASNKPTTSVFPHKRVSPGSGSKIGVSWLSIKVTETAPISSKKSLICSACLSVLFKRICTHAILLSLFCHNGVF